MALREDIPAQLPVRQPDGVLPEEMAPDDLENELFGPKPEAPAGPPPQKVTVADASGGVPPMPSQRPADAPLQSEGEVQAAQPQSLLKPNDSRYGDEQNIILQYVITQGGLPWLQAATDVAAGRVSPEQFEQIRVEHSKRIEEIVQRHPEFVDAAQKAVPFLSGLGMGILKPAASVAGTVARGVGAGAVVGAVQGYTGGDPETPSLSRERAVNAVSGAARGGALGAAGAGVAEGVRGAVKGAREVGRMRASDRAEREAADAAEARREAARQRAQQKRDQVKADAERQSNLARRFEEFKKPPVSPHETWSKVRETFNSDPGRVWRDFTSARGSWPVTLDELSRATNLPKAVLAKKLDKLSLDLDSRSKVQLRREIDSVMEAWDAYKARPKGSPKPPRAKVEDEGGQFGYRPQRQETNTMTGPVNEGDTSNVPYRGPAVERAKGEASPPANRPPYTGGKPRKPRAKR